MDFREWFIHEERQAIDPAVVQSYDRAFEAELEKLIQRARNNMPLRQSLEAMRQCPIRTTSGCTGWTDYIVGALLRHCGRTVDLGDSLNYIAFRMLSPVGERGQARRPLFDMDLDREYNVTVGNPLAARFRTFLMHDLRSVCGGKMRCLMASTRPSGTVSIGQRKSDNGATADEIPDRSNGNEDEMVVDIMDLLARQSTDDLPLLAVFQGMMRGEGSRVQRATFGHNKADRARKMVFEIIEDYADKTGNLALRNLLTKYRAFGVPDPTAHRSQYRVKQPKPLAHLSPDVRDYISILQVIQAAGGRATMALLGKKRRRWLERKPRSPASPERTRLHDVLANMLADGVLERHGAAYVLGPNSPQYLDLCRQGEPVGA